MLRSWPFLLSLIGAPAALGACARQPPSCICDVTPPVVTKSFVAGEFVHRVESMSVIDGAYALPPREDAWVATTLSFDEGFLLASLGEGDFALRVAAHVELEEPDPNRCCGPWFVTPAPPWSECRHARIDFSSELGGYPLSSDPALREIEPLFVVSEDLEDFDRPFALDDDMQGFTLRAQYLVTPEGCDEEACRSVVEVLHHFRRS